ncbi:Ferric/cupric reductase transmembrane component 7 [Emericellopsis cladophorae]|uniref:Ferric/cupric reductase transmembrane component 7 n=1 Tax=Emericellopsis cladophorae TaxID=2686198 RepID=A0A9P9Y427_9HYPO|nr:Ferric/cupric reductase transmembrane component 7 [Emericellopsis cladophorae]KAI6782753.1 Ferric/cupric reductase transmembrane component 7 [Emericellopsis cladophorae]
MSLPGLSQPVTLHSSRDTGMCMLTPEQCAYKQRHWLFWYEADHRYAFPTLALFLCTIIVFAVVHTLDAYGPNSWTQSKLRRRAAAATRWASLSALAGPVLATKANLTASLIGTFHENLLVWHNWVAWAMLILALFYNFPFIVQGIHAGDTAWLTFFSLRWLRERYYEIFKMTRFFAALIFILFFFFLHCDGIFTSWDYFIAAAALPHKEWLALGGEETLKIAIDTTVEWTPGQHTNPGTTVRVLLDGPYGGMQSRWYSGFDHAVVIAGGASAGFTLGLVEDFVARCTLTAAVAQDRNLTLVLSSRDLELKRWYLDAIAALLDAQQTKEGNKEAARIAGLTIHIHHTCIAHGSPADSSEDNSLPAKVWLP